MKSVQLSHFTFARGEESPVRVLRRRHGTASPVIDYHKDRHVVEDSKVLHIDHNEVEDGHSRVIEFLDKDRHEVEESK